MRWVCGHVDRYQVWTTEERLRIYGAQERNYQLRYAISTAADFDHMVSSLRSRARASCEIIGSVGGGGLPSLGRAADSTVPPRGKVQLALGRPATRRDGRIQRRTAHCHYPGEIRDGAGLFKLRVLSETTYTRPPYSQGVLNT